MDEAVCIRAFVPGDRAAVRRICCETADRGEPVEHFFSDRELFADLLTRYYIDDEPRSLWVAEQPGRIVGYLTGCLDSRRYRAMMTARIVPAVLLKGLVRAAFLHPQTWQLGVAAAQTWWRGGGAPRVALDAYPAHLHVNVAPDCRGQGIGRQLMERFLAQARHAGASGVHAPVRADNPRACRFFERIGFTELSRTPVVFPDGGAYRLHETVIYGKRL